MTIHNSTHYWYGKTLLLYLFLQSRDSQNELTGLYTMGGHVFVILKLLLIIMPTGDVVSFFQNYKYRKNDHECCQGTTSYSKTP